MQSMDKRKRREHTIDGNRSDGGGERKREEKENQLERIVSKRHI